MGEGRTQDGAGPGGYAERMETETISFDGVIGVEITGDPWNCVEIPGSRAFFGTGRAVRVDAVIDGVVLANVGAMVTGTGGHMISLSAKIRQRLGKALGDPVRVTITVPPVGQP